MVLKILVFLLNLAEFALPLFSVPSDVTKVQERHCFCVDESNGGTVGALVSWRRSRVLLWRHSGREPKQLLT